MIALTQGIVLKRIKYGDSSQIVHVFTRQFGLQSCMIKGLGRNRESNRRGNLLTPASIVELSIYYREEQNIKLIKEVHAGYFYHSLSEDIIKNSVAVFALEVLQNLLLADDVQEELFAFSRRFLIHLDESETGALANYPLYFLVHAGSLCGYRIFGSYRSDTPYLNLREGRFSSDEHLQMSEVYPESIPYMSRLNEARDYESIQAIKMSHDVRMIVLKQFLAFFQYHLPRFRPLKSVAVFGGIFS